MFRSSIPLLVIYLKVKATLHFFSKFIFNLHGIFILWILLVSYQILKNYPRWHKVCLTRIKDGDTIVYKAGEKLEELRTGRIWGIDAFESTQKPWGKISQKKLIQLVQFEEVHALERCQEVYVKEVKKDQYKRHLLFIKKHSVDQMTINEKMILSGWAMYYISPDWLGSEKQRWKKLQDMAKVSRKGIWKYPKKFWKMPSRFRKNISNQLVHHKDFDQKFSEPGQKF